MKPLKKHFIILDVNLQKIENIITSCKKEDSDPSLQVPVYFFAISKMQLEWERFVRHLIYDSSTGLFRNNSGPVRSLKIKFPTNRANVERVLKGMLPRNKQRFGPSWIDSKEAIDAAIMLQLTNASVIAANLGLTPWYLDDLRKTRNFFSHLSKESAIELRKTQLGVLKINDIYSLLFDYSYSSCPNYKFWMDFMRYVGNQITY